MPLILKKPLVVFDIESTGINPRVNRIVEFGAVKLNLDHSRETINFRINPQCKIPAETTALHGISDDDVADAPIFADSADRILDFIKDCDLGGFNLLRFDIPILQEEFRRIKRPLKLDEVSIVDAQKIFHAREPRNLTAAVKFYCDKDLENAHTALADSIATLDVIEGQCKRYADLPREVEELGKLCVPTDPDRIDMGGKLRWQGNNVIIAFGQKSGRTLQEMTNEEPGYLRWILNKDFSSQVKKIVSAALSGNYPTRK